MTAVLLITILGAVLYVMGNIARITLNLFAVWAAGEHQPSAEAGGPPMEGEGH